MTAGAPGENEFLEVNGWEVALDDEAAFRLVMEVAAGRFDVEGISGSLDAALTSVAEP